MKAHLSKIIFLVWSLLWAVPAHSLDATSFNPTAVEVTAKATSSIPVGTIIAWPVAQNPADWQNSDGSYNWLECNGQSISKTVYPELFALVGGQVPDLRGLFLRGYDAHQKPKGCHSTWPLGCLFPNQVRSVQESSPISPGSHHPEPGQVPHSCVSQCHNALTYGSRGRAKKALSNQAPGRP